MRIAETGRSTTAPHPMRRAGDAVTMEAVSATSGALVAVAAPMRTAPMSSSLSRPDASFITHLIATAEQDPQTRTLRRAAAADVETAYRTVVARNAATPHLLVKRTA